MFGRTSSKVKLGVGIGCLPGLLGLGICLTDCRSYIKLGEARQFKKHYIKGSSACACRYIVDKPVEGQWRMLWATCGKKKSRRHVRLRLFPQSRGSDYFAFFTKA